MSLTTRQREVLSHLNTHGSVLRHESDPRQWGCARGDTLQALVDAGLAEWDDAPSPPSSPRWPRIVKPGTNAARKAAEAEQGWAKARARADRISTLYNDRLALATAVADLEEALANQPRTS